MWPFLTHTGYWASHDGAFHLYRLLSLQEGWRQGHFYPRIFPDFAFGYGFAVLHFYGPLSYYIALAVSAFTSSQAATKLTFALSYPLAALSIWWLVRDLWRSKNDPPHELAGLAAAVAYTYLPYHVADVQLRGALAESWAFVWWPLLFWAAWRGRRWPVALSLAALILTHNLSVVLVALPLTVWSVVAARTKEPVSPNERTSSPLTHLREIAIGVAIALLVTAFYWLPVILESRYVWISQDVGGLGFATHLAPWREWIAPSATYRYFPDHGVGGEHPLSWAQLGLLALSLLVLPPLLRSSWRTPVLFWWGALLASLFLLTPASFPLWKTLVFPFGLVQYPWRWLGIIALATAILASAPLAILYRLSSIVELTRLPQLSYYSGSSSPPCSISPGWCAMWTPPSTPPKCGQRTKRQGRLEPPGRRSSYPSR